MEQNTINGVWLEGQIDDNGISLTLISESKGSGAQVEEIKHFDISELEQMSGELFSLNLSDETSEALVGNSASRDSGQSEIEDYADSLQSEIEALSELETSPRPTPERGQIMVDDNPAPWSDDDRVEVIYATDYEARNFDMDDTGSTVAQANPSYPEDDTVILAKYVGSVKEYAFPASRLKYPDCEIRDEVLDV
jgi:hypothetical protein